MSNNMQEKNYLCRTFGTFGFRHAAPAGKLLDDVQEKKRKTKTGNGNYAAARRASWLVE
jgi:hypothetical protein|tara:strand:+ start:876 stop:1052 length:177 start_codon:yes stop_codon:yes gene_type:complete